ncbi:MAG: signal peptidase I [Candidatus Dormibacteraeota bacterium]|nr:signal peptidase I [Candidatus Dormibacteraeota bacterium]
MIQSPGEPSGTEEIVPTASAALPTRLLSVVGFIFAGLAVLALLLLTIGPLVLPYKTLTVYSGSMEPAIHTGSVIVDVPVAAKDVKKGDVITFQKPSDTSQLVTHRVVEVESGPGGLSFITKGDANPASDSWRVPASGNGYKLWFTVPGIGFLLAWLQSPLGRILFLVIPAILLGGLFLYEMWWPRRPAGAG